ncbi:signal transduction histidine kinase [Lipingzhangella halophila]|uniref:histidine kinase n=1 Tax=Lipingzhangella halophila TaxID=1783352 RepID=A0A7W7RM02_9ACTN|nr:histidine kinase [Lipingzhangella halophila]MBB4934450.1 signal transduction histidine kinase [Lipingzhangella halophila]
MFAVSAVLRRPVTYLRVVFLLVGSALALSFALLDGTLILIMARQMGGLLTIAVAVVIVVVPPVVLGLMSAVRQVEAAAAESLLGVTFLHGTPGPARHAGQRVRAATWFVLHLLAGGVVILDAAVVVPIGWALITAPVRVPAGMPVSSLSALGWLRATGGWGDAWMPLAGLVCLAAAVTAPMGLGALVARAAPALLGPSTAERLQRLQAQTAWLAESNRIARELHDSVGHALSLVTLQAVAARKLRTRDPQFADEALETIESTARAATADLDHMLGLLRDGTAYAEKTCAPEPDLNALEPLIAAIRAAGLNIEADIADDLADLPEVVSREAYRIIQEGLTNALRHAADDSARLEIARRPRRLLITVTNPAAAGGTARRGHGPGNSRGVGGMAERVHALGGSITQGPHDGTWCLAVELPLPTGGAS